MRVVPRRTVVGDVDRRFDNLSGSHHQSHVNCVSSVYGAGTLELPKLWNYGASKINNLWVQIVEIYCVENVELYTRGYIYIYIYIYKYIWLLRTI